MDGPVSAEVVSVVAKDMIREGRKLSKIHKNVIVKCPMIRDGIEACAALGKEGIRVNVTLCFSPAQADQIHSVPADVVDPAAIYDNYDFDTQILAASLRGPTHVIESALAGAHIGTMPFKVRDMLFNHPLTDKGLEQFLKDYNQTKQSEPAGATR